MIAQIKRVLGITALLLVAIYAGDFVSAKYKVPNRQVLYRVQVVRDFAVKDNDKSTEYTAPMTVDEECVAALFPHFGDKPCWYLRGHTIEHLELDGGAYQFNLGQP